MNRGMWFYTNEIEDEPSQHHEGDDEDGHTDDRVYTVMIIYRLVFDSHVHDLHQVRSWCEPKMDSLQDDWVGTIKECVEIS